MTQSHPYSHPAHRRALSASSHVFKSPALRSSHPAIHRNKGSSSISKLGPGLVGHSRSLDLTAATGDDVDDDTQSEMATSFLNFCAMCERQITVPDNSLLYCSESCRRKDSCKPLSASLPSMASSSFTITATTPPSSPPLSPRIIVAPMTPTRAPTGSIPAIRIPTDLHMVCSDPDPTEWKPVISIRPAAASSRASSEAWQFLSRFHGEHAPVKLPERRPDAAGHRSTASLSTLANGPAATTLPSLAHSPTTPTSSYSSSSSSDYMSYAPELIHRPLPPRHHSSNAVKGVELVVPHFDVASEDVVAFEVSNGGSLFPASSALWEEVPTKNGPVISVAPVYEVSEA
ncbi:hypothetical protein ASPZODRAFT_1815719 [Penicilliopsis zonata CBS 506.65]|uniref:Life-span regulatory factor domain-containing protein n=1 Tax=Penicilliopsis zonata CBS 506.65 TaxID=1073090 RepID=A0A1L9SLM5_9EURO|nr:hypothetical protein ASPZODRAFT_1815719 [Penicilliopsis zonata CBS 506.65]OJJ47954.1 hypothetical protein ASPZODRAFT_1815719 [Penicilliopsis zonata CBS 506.65]